MADHWLIYWLLVWSQKQIQFRMKPSSPSSFHPLVFSLYPSWTGTRLRPEQSGLMKNCVMIEPHLKRLLSVRITAVDFSTLMRSNNGRSDKTQRNSETQVSAGLLKDTKTLTVSPFTASRSVVWDPERSVRTVRVNGFLLLGHYTSMSAWTDETP